MLFKFESYQVIFSKILANIMFEKDISAEKNSPTKSNLSFIHNTNHFRNISIHHVFVFKFRASQLLRLA